MSEINSPVLIASMSAGLAVLILGRSIPAASIIALIIIVASVAVGLFGYLQRGSISGRLELRTMLSQVDDLRTQMADSEQALAEKVFSDADKHELKQAVLERLQKLEIRDALSEIMAKPGDEERQAALGDLRKLYDGIIDSLDRQILDLGRRANLNLVMGSTITIIGLTVLSYFVFYAVHPPSAAITETTIYFGTRLTLVVFIEIFAYFFLRLYRYGLFETKYFQNELTNARFKIVALEACSREGSKPTLDKMCMELVKTERNFVLKKGETTLSLRRDEIEQMSDNSVAKLVERILISRDSAEAGVNKTP